MCRHRTTWTGPRWHEPGRRALREPYNGRALAELAELLEASGWKIEGGEVRRPAWHAEAACRGVGPEPFFVEDKGPGATNSYRDAVERYCQHCPVVEPCRAAGAHERHGLWGGESPRRRRAAA